MRKLPGSSTVRAKVGVGDCDRLEFPFLEPEDCERTEVQNPSSLVLTSYP